MWCVHDEGHRTPAHQMRTRAGAGRGGGVSVAHGTGGRSAGGVRVTEDEGKKEEAACGGCLGVECR